MGMRRVGDLEVSQDLDHEKKFWLVQRIGWALLFLLWLAGVAGLFGSGPLSGSTASAPDLRLEYDRFVRGAPAELSEGAWSAIRGLAADLPAVWSAPTTTPADRQRVARLLLGKVVVRVDRSSERVDVTLHWVGGVVRPHTITRPVTCYRRQSDYPRLVARLRELCRGRLTATAIADRLNAEGLRPPKRTGRFTRDMVLRLTAHLGLARRQRHGSTTGLGPDEYRPMQLARRLGVSRDTARGWVRRRWVTTRTDADGHHIIWADADELRRLGQLPGLRPNWANKQRLAALRRPKPRPKPSASAPTKPR